MSDLMDTKKAEKTRSKSEDAGEIIHGDNWQLNHNEYVIVKKPNGDIVTGNKVEKPDDDELMMNW